MATKKPISSIREEMRALGQAADEATGSGAAVNEWFTPDFWTMVVATATNLLSVAVVLGWLNTTDAAELTKALSALLGAAQVIMVNSALVWKFFAARVEMKQAAITAKYQYMAAALELQRIRADRGNA
jgi:hypothetical protein